MNCTLWAIATGEAPGYIVFSRVIYRAAVMFAVHIYWLFEARGYTLDKRVASITDLFRLETFHPHNSCQFSPNNRYLAIGLSKKAGSNFVSTNRFGSEHREQTIKVFDLLSQNQLPIDPIINADQGDVNIGDVDHGRAEALSPAWSPDSKHLAFICKSYVKDETAAESYKCLAILMVWCAETNATRKVTDINIRDWEVSNGPFTWIDNVTLLVSHEAGEHKDILGGDWNSQLKSWNDARYNQKCTASVLQHPQTTVSLHKQSHSILSLFSIEDSERVDIDENYPLGERIRLTSSNEIYLYAERENENALLTLSDAHPAHCDQIVFGTLKGNYPKLTKSAIHLSSHYFYKGALAIDPVESSVWTFSKTEKSDDSFLSWIDLTTRTAVHFSSPAWRLEGDMIDQLVYPHLDGRVIFYAISSDKNAKQTRHDWFAFNRREKTFVNLTAHCSKPPSFLVELRPLVFVGQAQNTLLKYELVQDRLIEQPVTFPFAAEEETPKKITIVWPFDIYRRIRFVALPRNDQNHMVIRMIREGQHRFFVTLDGTTFHPIGDADKTRVVASNSHGSDPNICLISNLDHETDIKTWSGLGTQSVYRTNTFLAEIQQSKTVFFDGGGKDEKSLKCEMLLPPDFDAAKKYPAVVMVYPEEQYGPHSQTSLQTELYPRVHNPHLLAAQNYVVLFAAMPIDQQSLSSSPVAEQLLKNIDLCIAEAQKHVNIDNDRLFVKGHSWGAQAVAMILTITHKFKAAICSAGDYNPIGTWGTFDPRFRYSENTTFHDTNIVLSQNSIYASGPPWKDMEQFLQTNPLLQSAKIETPMLLLHGDQDMVPIQGAEQMFKGLQAQGKKVKFVRYFGEGHIISSRSNVEHCLETKIDWLKQHDV
jgi:predicted peptidase